MMHKKIFSNYLVNEVELTKNGSLYVLKFPCNWDRMGFRNMFNNGAFLGKDKIEFDKTYTKDRVIAMAKAYIQKYNLAKVIDKTK